MSKNLTRDNKTKKPWALPVLRWAGSKRKLLPVLLDCVPTKYNRYLEPFAGSACLFFALNPAKSTLGDINPHLIHTYKIIRQHPRKLARQVARLPQTKSEYYRIRSVHPDTLHPIERAVRFVYLNRLCFNGVYRTNRRGDFNVPLGSKTGAIPSEQNFFRCSVALRSADFLATDFEECCSRSCSGDFVYLDPPYSKSARNSYGEYGYNSFQPIDIDRLLSCLESLDSVKANFLLSYANTAFVRRKMQKWAIKCITVRRHIAGFARHRGQVKEVLIANFEF